ncbi:MAG: MBL fold metallo-hydrolase [Butyricicoccaceae bacterium]
MQNFYYSLASGSSGNCAVWYAGDTAVLIDAGISFRAINQGLSAIGMSFSDLSAVLLTHEHIDHIKALGTMLKKSDIPIHATFGTAAAILQKLPAAEKNLQPFSGGERFSVDGLRVQSIPSPHDAAEPVCYRIDGGGSSLGYATDLGYLPSTIRDRLMGCETIVLESNHDVEMLRDGPYPWHLKERIRGTRGHLSNDDCAAAASQFAINGTQRLILSHLSDKNNTPLTALHATEQFLQQNHLDCEVIVAPRARMEQPILIHREEETQCSLFA